MFTDQQDITNDHLQDNEANLSKETDFPQEFFNDPFLLKKNLKISLEMDSRKKATEQQRRELVNNLLKKSSVFSYISVGIWILALILYLAVFFIYGMRVSSSLNYILTVVTVVAVINIIVVFMGFFIITTNKRKEEKTY